MLIVRQKSFKFFIAHLKTQKPVLKFIYSEKAKNFCKISTVDLSYVVTVKSTVEILQNIVAFSEYINFTIIEILKFCRIVVRWYAITTEKKLHGLGYIFHTCAVYFFSHHNEIFSGRKITL